jgi:hypothetical protein
MQAPRMTVDNGRPAVLRIADDQKFVTGLTVTMKDGSPVITPKTETYTSGVQLSLWPIISAEQQQVRVCLRAALRDVDLPAPAPVSVRVGARQGDDFSWKPVAFSQKLDQPRPHATVISKTFAVPAGQTMLLDGGSRDREYCRVRGPEILSDIPFLCDLFSTECTEQETEHLFVMVTPRVVHKQDEERLLESTTTGPELTRAMVAAMMKRFNASCKAGKYDEAEVLAKLACEVDPHNTICSAALQTARTMRLRNDRPGVPPAPMKVMIPCGAVETVAMPCPKLDGATVAEVMARYRQACAAGHLAEARELASKALAIDPTCFTKSEKVHP